jgi:transposase
MPPCNISHNIKACIPIIRLEFGFSVKEICDILGIRKSLIYKTLHYQCLYGTTSNPHAQSTFSQCKLSQNDPAFIRDMIAQQHCVYLDKIQEELFARRGTLVLVLALAWALRGLGFSCKKVTTRAVEHNEILWAFMNRIGMEVLDLAMLMFVDESAKDDQMSGQRMGWSRVGTRCVQRRCFAWGRCYSIQ